MTTSSGAVERVDSLTESSQFRWYLSGHSAWFVGLGLQMVLFPFLVAEVLNEPAQRVGIAQTSLMAPSVLLMLLGGAVADRFDKRYILIILNAAAMLPPVTLALLLSFGQLTFGAIIIYALTMGTLSAFAIPTRDSMLSFVLNNVDERTGGVETKIQRGVAVANAAQFGGQTVGMLLAALASVVGVPPVILMHGVMAIVGAWTSSKLIPVPPIASHQKQDTFKAIKEGFVEVYRSPTLLPMVLVSLAVGLFFVGTFNVCLPLFVRDDYGGGAYKLAIAITGFFLGTIVSTLTLMRIGRFHYRGRVLFLALLFGSIILSLMSLRVPFPVLCTLTFMWGLGAGVSLTLSRGLVQELAPDSHRARILSIYQLGFGGGGPFGSLATGYLAKTFGAHGSVIFPSTIMFIFLIATVSLTKIWSLDAPDQKSATV